MITADNLCVELGNRQVLSNISFQIRQGDFMAIIGPNGGGKSTLLRTVLGLTKASAGSLSISGPAANTPERTESTSIGYVPQVKSLDRSFPAKAIELVATSVRGRWPHRISKTERRVSLESLEKVGAKHLADQSIRTLSGGELQRIFLARAIINNPNVLLLDEPESGIDLSGTQDLYALLERLHKEINTCILMVTHDWDVAFHHATHALLINTEQIAFGPPDQALTDSAIRNTFGHVGHKHATFTSHEHSHEEHTHE